MINAICCSHCYFVLASITSMVIHRLTSTENPQKKNKLAYIADYLMTEKQTSWYTKNLVETTLFWRQWEHKLCKNYNEYLSDVWCTINTTKEPFKSY